MCLLDKLWDDVVAGPRPSEGLSKLRKIKLVDQTAADDQLTVEQQSRLSAVTRSIPIQRRKPPTLAMDVPSEDSSSVPSSPSGSLSPSMASPAAERASRQSFFRQCNSATMACDLMVISALDK